MMTVHGQQRLLVLPPGLPPNATSLESLTLPHPRTACPTTFLLAQTHSSSPEPIHLLSLDLVSNPQSVFINNSVHRSGSFLLATPFDPTFLLLHLLLARSTTTAVLLDDLLHSPTCPDLALLAHNHLALHLDELLRAHLCSAVQATPDLWAYRLDQSKATRWLAAKTRALAQALESRKEQGAGTVYPPLPAPHIVGNDAFTWTRFALMLLGEWLPEAHKHQWTGHVSEALGVPDVTVPKPGVLDQLVAASVAGTANKHGDDDDGGSSKKKAKTSTAATKAVNKAAAIKVPKGQRSVAAFFSKKS